MARRFVVRWLLLAAFLAATIFVLAQGQRSYDKLKFDLEYLEDAGRRAGRKIKQGASRYTQKNTVEPFSKFQRAVLTARSATRAIVVARKSDENIAWLNPIATSERLTTIYPYTVDEAVAVAPYLAVPANKGHEAMPYLTYLIDATADPGKLADVSIFIHAHQKTWHNNDLLSSDMADMLQLLEPATVKKAGYMNLRCHLQPGCSEPLRPQAAANGEIEYDPQRPEEGWISEAWQSLFPGEEAPETLMQPCCGQFAVSKEAILAVDRNRYIAMREWLLKTPLSDSVAGRIFEYVWQSLWKGEDEVCPDEVQCYCEGYGVCFDEGRKGYQEWFDIRTREREVNKKLARMIKKKEKMLKEEQYRSKPGEERPVEEGEDDDDGDSLDDVIVDEIDMKELHDEGETLRGVIERKRLAALNHGRDLKARKRVLDDL